MSDDDDVDYGCDYGRDADDVDSDYANCDAVKRGLFVGRERGSHPMDTKRGHPSLQKKDPDGDGGIPQSIRREVHQRLCLHAQGGRPSLGNAMSRWLEDPALNEMHCV